ncbi:hypothetical protein PIB30_040758, partial [Stylosanthes scabra]|nr:hypothetical protein [Stylosanthes scabra]
MLLDPTPPEAGTSTAVQSPETVVTDVLLSMNRAESDNLLGDQCKTPDIPLQQQDLEEREELPRFQRDVYCVPPEILTRMFDTYGTNYLDKKTKLPHRLELLNDHADYMGLLDRDKPKSHSA